MNINEIASLGSNVKPVIQNKNCSVLMLNDATGEGVMTVYRVMPGVMICFSDMYLEQFSSAFRSVMGLSPAEYRFRKETYDGK